MPNAMRKRQRIVVGEEDQESEDSRCSSDSQAFKTIGVLPQKLKEPLPRLRVVLDIDGTLICSNTDINVAEGIAQAPINWKQNESGKVRVNIRPGLRSFLTQLHDVADLYIFTAGTEGYARPIVDFLEQDGPLFKGKFYRDHCATIDFCGLKDLPTKDLSVLGDIFEPRRTVLLDDSLHCFVPQPKNGMPISAFVSNPLDEGLKHAFEFIIGELLDAEDVRPVLEKRYRIHKKIERELTMHEKVLHLMRLKMMAKERTDAIPCDSYNNLPAEDTTKV
jgi:Dullard-like phosphatase family protein